MTNIAQGFGRRALDLLFPPECALCREPTTLLCDACAAALPAAAGDRCARCAMPVRSPFDLCAHCSERMPAFSRAAAAFVMDGGARRLAHLLKYDGITSLAPALARLMFARAPIAGVDLVAAVPLHRGRERSRGYNQAALIAGAFAGMAGVPYAAAAAQRVRSTVPLVKTMHRDERIVAMRGAFAADSAVVGGKRLLVIDDVMTTGATLDACSRAMLDAGARDVRCLVWARAD